MTIADLIECALEDLQDAEIEDAEYRAAQTVESGNRPKPYGSAFHKTRQGVVRCRAEWNRTNREYDLAFTLDARFIPDGEAALILREKV